VLLVVLRHYLQLHLPAELHQKQRQAMLQQQQQQQMKVKLLWQLLALQRSRQLDQKGGQPGVPSYPSMYQLRRHVQQQNMLLLLCLPGHH
jgi:hypothetical protein